MAALVRISDPLPGGAPRTIFKGAKILSLVISRGFYGYLDEDQHGPGSRGNTADPLHIRENDMSATWVLVADGAKARLFEVSAEGHSLVEIEDYFNPAGAASGRELSRDRPASTHDRFGHARHNIEPHTTLRKKSAEVFARELNEVLERARLDHRYGNVVLIAPAHFLGTLNAALDKHVRARVTAELPKDLTWADAKTILSHLPI